MPKCSRLRSGHTLARRWFAKAGLEAHADAYIPVFTRNPNRLPIRTMELYPP